MTRDAAERCTILRGLVPSAKGGPTPGERRDLDLTIYSLRKWMRLALKGNPTILLRLGYQGVELLTTGQLSLPMREPERSYRAGMLYPGRRVGAAAHRPGDHEPNSRTT
jgi:hypothetical protein